MVPTLWRRLWSFLRQRRLREELQAELAFHLAMKEQEQAAAGLSREEATYAARSQMGSLALALEESRDVWIWTALEQWVNDVRHALRVLRKSPVFTLCAVLILALGIGVNGAIFILIDGLLLRPLPVPESERLQQISLAGTGSDMDGVNALSYPLFEELRARTHSLLDLFTWNSTNLSLGWGPSAHTIVGAAISGEGYQALKLQAQAGRLLGPSDDVPGASLCVVISDHFWTRKFSRDRKAIGQTLLLNRKSFVIVGVTPRSFTGVMAGETPDVTLSIHAMAAFYPPRDLATETSLWYLAVIGRLREGTTEQSARAELATLASSILKRQISLNTEFWHNGQKFSPKTLVLRPVVGTSVPAQTWRRSLWCIHAIAILLLLITGVNLTSMYSARTMERHKELAIRVALGSSRFRLVRQLLTESWLLCSGGLAGGFFVAQIGVKALIAFLSDPNAPLVIDGQFDWRMALFMTSLVLGTTALVGLAPVWGGTQIEPYKTIKQAVVGPVRGSFRLFSRALIAMQICLAVVLLLDSLLFVQTVSNLKNQNLGINRRNLLSVSLDASQAGLTMPQLANLYTNFLERLRRNPNIRSVALTDLVPIAGAFSWQTMSADLWPFLNSRERMLYQFEITPQYLQTVGLSLRRGRDFLGSDSSTTSQVAILNHAAAQTYFGNENPIGQILRVSTKASYRIIGEVESAKYFSLREEAPRTIYVKTAGLPVCSLIVRATLDRTAAVQQIRTVLRQTGKDVQVGEVISMTEQIDRALTSERLLAFVASFFACVAAVLVAVGSIGSVGYTVSRRTSEIGVRLALGSSRTGILWLLAREPLGQCLLGLVVGVPLAIATANLARSFLYGLLPYDPFILLLSVLLIVFVTGVGTLLPALRAARLEPVTALRYE